MIHVNIIVEMTRTNLIQFIEVIEKKNTILSSLEESIGFCYRYEESKC